MKEVDYDKKWALKSAEELRRRWRVGVFGEGTYRLQPEHFKDGKYDAPLRELCGSIEVDVLLIVKGWYIGYGYEWALKIIDLTKKFLKMCQETSTPIPLAEYEKCIAAYEKFSDKCYALLPVVEKT